MNNIQTFTNDLFGSVRSIEINGEPWFVGKDIAKCLGYQYPVNAIQDHVDSEDKIGDGVDKSPTPPIIFVDSIGRQQTQYPIWINESGLYSLIFSSKLPAAKSFKHWVTSEVLPTMRRLGFNNSMQILNNQLQQLQIENNNLKNQNLNVSLDRAFSGEARSQTIDKIKNLPNGTVITDDIKNYLIKYDEGWGE